MTAHSVPSLNLPRFLYVSGRRDSIFELRHSKCRSDCLVFFLHCRFSVGLFLLRFFKSSNVFYDLTRYFDVNTEFWSEEFL